MSAVLSGRTLFVAALLVLSSLYTYIAFGLPLTTKAGQIGPGFFPRTIGVLLIATLAWALVAALRRDASAERVERPRVGATLLAVALIVLFLPTLLIFGALIGMMLYTLASLFLFNRGKPLLNVLIGIGFPIVLLLLFDTWLNATLPRAALPFIPWP